LGPLHYGGSDAQERARSFATGFRAPPFGDGFIGNTFGRFRKGRPRHARTLSGTRQQRARRIRIGSISPRTEMRSTRATVVGDLRASSWASMAVQVVLCELSPAPEKVRGLVLIGGKLCARVTEGRSRRASLAARAPQLLDAVLPKARTSRGAIWRPTSPDDIS